MIGESESRSRAQKGLGLMGEDLTECSGDQCFGYDGQNQKRSLNMPSLGTVTVKLEDLPEFNMLNSHHGAIQYTCELVEHEGSRLDEGTLEELKLLRDRINVLLSQKGLE